MAELEEQGLTSSGGTSQSSPQISTGLCGSCDKAVISHFDGKHILSEGMMGGGVMEASFPEQGGREEMLSAGPYFPTPTLLLSGRDHPVFP